MAEYSKLATGSFTSTGGAQPVLLPFQPDRVELINFSAAATPANHGVPFAYWNFLMGQGTAVEQVFNATPVLTTDVVASNGISTFSAGLALQYGPVVQHGGSPVSDFSISKANPAVVTTVGNHGLTSGQVITFSNLFQTATTGMPQITDIPFVVTVTGNTTFTIPWNTNQSNYTAFNTATSTGNIGSYKQILFPSLYFPGVSDITSLTLGATTVVNTTAPHNFMLGQEVAFRISPAWGTTQLNSLPNNLIPGSPIYGFVSNAPSPTQVVVTINSTGFTAFNTNVPVSSAVGLTPAQIVAVGDNNTGTTPFAPTGTINGPAVLGSYVNNTAQGFIVGSGAGTNDTSSVLVGAAGNIIFWTAYFDDIN